MAAWSEACRAQRGLVIATPAAQLHYLQRFLSEPLVGEILPFAAHTPVPVPLHAWFRWHGALVQWVEDPADLAYGRKLVGSTGLPCQLGSFDATTIHNEKLIVLEEEEYESLMLIRLCKEQSKI